MEKMTVEEAIALLTKPAAGGPGRENYGKKIVTEFIDSNALFARERYTNEKERASKMLSIKKYLKDADMESKVWVKADGASIVFTNMALAAKAEAATKKPILDAFNAHVGRYQNVGRKK